MSSFLGYDNVINAVPVFGADGVADAFDIDYEVFHDVRVAGKIVPKSNVFHKRVYVREFDPNSVKGDGALHGFGKPTIYKRSNPAKAKKPAKKELSDEFKQYISKKIVKVVKK